LPNTDAERVELAATILAHDLSAREGNSVAVMLKDRTFCGPEIRR
jgi:hypothetical protein